MTTKLVLAALSVLWLLALYALIDAQAMMSALSGVDLARLGASMLLLLALVGASALRLALLARASGYQMSVGEAVAATFAANALNVALPAKLGDMLKCTVMARGRREDLLPALSLCVWEKIADLASLFALAALALALAGGPPLGALAMLALAAGLGAVLLAPSVMEAAAGLVSRLVGSRLGGSRLGGSRLGAAERLARRLASALAALRAQPAGLASALALTLLIWAGHLAQICLMLWALGATGDAGFWLTIAALAPAAIVAGLLPISFAGVGARDAALVAVLSGLISQALAAALGLLFFLRYLVPGLVGAAFLPRFAASIAALTAERGGAKPAGPAEPGLAP